MKLSLRILALLLAILCSFSVLMGCNRTVEETESETESATIVETEPETELKPTPGTEPPATETQVSEEKGCASTVQPGLLLRMIAWLPAVAFRRKKETE